MEEMAEQKQAEEEYWNRQREIGGRVRSLATSLHSVRRNTRATSGV